MLLGQSIFQSVVERLSLEEEEKATEPHVAVNYRVSGLSAGFVQNNGQVQQTTVDRAQDQYLDLMGNDEVLPQSPPIIPDHLGRLSPHEIATDLGLADGDDAAVLQAKRRAFAMQNHPDRVDVSFIKEAHIRMTIANQLVDEALLKRMLRKP
jgi:hypothetical protein